MPRVAEIAARLRLRRTAGVVKRYVATPEQSQETFGPHYAHLAERQGDTTGMGVLADHAEEIESPLAGLYRAMFDQAPTHAATRFGLPEGNDAGLFLYHGGHVNHYIKGDNGWNRYSVQHQFYPTRDGNVIVSLTANDLRATDERVKGHYAVVPQADAEEYIRHLSTPGANWYWAHGEETGGNRYPTNMPVVDLRNAIEAATGRVPGRGNVAPADEDSPHYSRTARRYAAYRAPAGGMIAPPVADPLFAGLPGQFYEGGKFVSGKSVVPQKKKFDMAAIRKKVRARKLPPNPNADAGEPARMARMARVVRRYARADDRAAFEHAIDQQPENATTHLVYADWLDENGEPDEAAFRRAMGEWVQRNGLPRPHASSGKDENGNWRYPHMVGAGYNRTMPMPSGVDINEVTRLQPESLWGGWARWNSYRHMEEGLRRAFMANRRPQQMARNVKRYALTGDPADEQAFHRSLIYDTNPGELTPHLAYMDWLQENGREKLADFLRRGLESGDEGGIRHFLRPGSTQIGNQFPATAAHLGYVGELSLHVAKPTRDTIALSATPRQSFTDPLATEVANPFHYWAYLTPNEAHDLADEMRQVKTTFPWGVTENLGKELKNYLRQSHIPDTRPRPTTPEVEERENPEQMARAVRRYAASPDLSGLFRAARENPYETAHHGVIADAIEEQFPESPIPELIRAQFGLGQHTEAKNNLWYEPVENSWDGTFPYAARIPRIPRRGPFDIYLRHEGRLGEQGENQRWVVHAVSTLPGSRDFGYTFEFPHEEAHLIPKMFPGAERHIGPYVGPRRGKEPWFPGGPPMPREWNEQEWRQREADDFVDRMDDEERNRP